MGERMARVRRWFCSENPHPFEWALAIGILGAIAIASAMSCTSSDVKEAARVGGELAGMPTDDTGAQLSPELVDWLNRLHDRMLEVEAAQGGEADLSSWDVLREALLALAGGAAGSVGVALMRNRSRAAVVAGILAAVQGIQPDGIAPASQKALVRAGVPKSTVRRAAAKAKAAAFTQTFAGGPKP